MLSLFIDTHSKKIIIALLENEKIISQNIVDERIDHSTLCMPTLRKTMEEGKKAIHELTDIIVVNGPGSFTGERLGVTIAKTLAYTLKVPIRTITSLETTLATVELTQNRYLALEEKNGFFLAEFDSNKKLITDYTYVKKMEFQLFQQEHHVIMCQDYDIEKAVIFAHQKQPTNCHQTNPFYVKKIEVEK